MKHRKILIIYTGGTIGMVQDMKTGSLLPFDFQTLMQSVPGLHSLKIDLEAYCFETLIDSSDMGPEGWIHIAQVIEKRYPDFDGFVVLHGTDTMAYTASALSFMLENLQKPVILTGSQLPIDVMRSDGKDNLINALEMAAAVNDKGFARIREVGVVFGSQLFRGNRITKFSAESFNAFVSANFPPLAKAGVHIKWNTVEKNVDLDISPLPFKVYTHLETNVLIIKVHPGMTAQTLGLILQTPGLKGVILGTYGSGNAPTAPAFIEKLAQTIQEGIPVLNVTQCTEGTVEMGKYAASNALKAAGVINGQDLTTESAVTKMMFVLGMNLSLKDTEFLLCTPLRGEMSIEESCSKSEIC